LAARHLRMNSRRFSGSVYGTLSSRRLLTAAL
jgi:hypothetical protein